MSNNTEYTLVLIKPDAIKRRLVDKIMLRFEDVGLDVFHLVHVRYTTLKVWQDHYSEHKDKPHYNRLVSYMANKPIIVICYSGIDAINQTRKLVGPTNVLDAPPGTIRGDFGRLTTHIADNLVHASDSAESAHRELRLWFGDDWMGSLV